MVEGCNLTAEPPDLPPCTLIKSQLLHQPQEQLDQAEEAFEYWRATRETKNQTPKKLITQAVDLLEHYSRTEVVSRLGIRQEALSRWSSDSQSTDNAFIMLPATSPELPLLTNKPSSLNLSIAFAHGTTVNLSGTPPEAAEFLVALQQGMAL